MSTRLAVIAYGGFAYLTFFAVFLYTIGFLGGIAVPKGIDDGASGSVVLALVVNLVLLSLFAVQHSVMARPWFKRAWTRIVPTSVERSTYVLASNAVIALLLWQWRSEAYAETGFKQPGFYRLVPRPYVRRSSADAEEAPSWN